MRKLLLLICALLTGVSGAWGQTNGTITLTKSDIEFLRNYDQNTLDINSTARNATRFASIVSPLVGVNNGGGNINVANFKIHSSGTNTIQMLAEYTITSYSITVTPAKATTFSVSGGTADKNSLSASEEVTINVTGVNANSCSFTFAGNPDKDYNEISQIVVNYSYTTAPTMVQTMADFSYNNYSSCPTYTITSSRTTLYVEKDGTNLTTITGIDNPSDARKKFAFVKNTTTNEYYLYNVAEQKFVNQDHSLSIGPSHKADIHFTNNFSYPQYLRVGTNYVNTQSQKDSYAPDGVLINTYVKPDEGNSLIIEPAGTADVTRAHKLVNGWTATYHIDGTSFTATGDLTYNATLALPNTLKRAYCTYKYYSDAECENEITTANDVYDDIYVKYNYTGPFAFSKEGESPEYVYYLLRTYNNNFLYADGSSIAVTTTSNTGDAYQWAIVGNPYAYTLKNKSTGTYMVASYSSNGEATLGASGTNFGLYTNTQAPETNHFTAVTTNGNNLVIPQNHPNAGSGIRCYNGTGAKFTDVTGLNNLAGAFFIPFAVVTYNLIWNESTIQSTTKGSIIGTKSEDEKPWTVPAYSSFAYDVATIGKTTSAVNVTMSWTGPFEFSSSFNDATWYNLKINGSYLIYASAGNYTLDTSISNAESAGYDAFWGFMGNPVDGVQIINKSAGEGKTLAPFSPPSMSGDTYSWTIRQWNTNFSLDWSYNYLNNVDGTFKLYNSSTTSGDPTNIGCSVESASYRGLALDFIDDYANNHAVGHYFGVATSTYNSIRALYADAASVSASEYTTLVSYIGGMLPASYPETGYYRIKSNSGRYIGYGQPEADPMPSVGLRTVSAEDAAKDASTIIHLVKGVGSHQYTMSTQGKNVQSMVNGNTPFPATSDAGVTFVLEALTTTPGKGTIRNTASNNEDNGYINGYLHEANWTVPGVINWEAGSVSSLWEIEDATSIDVPLSTVGEASYSTLYVDFPVAIPDGNDHTAIYTLSESDGNYTLNKQTSAGAKQGIILRDINKDESVTLNIAASSDVTSVLTGSLLAGTAGENCYIFGKGDEGLGFYHYTSGSTLAANRAYLTLSGSNVRSLVLNFDDAQTGISNTETSAQPSAIYDLQGRRAYQPQKGLYIVNGKKVLF